MYFHSFAPYCFVADVTAALVRFLTAASIKCVLSYGGTLSCLNWLVSDARSATKMQSPSRITRSKKDAGAPTPQNILRRSLKNNIREVRKESTVYILTMDMMGPLKLVWLLLF